MRLTTVRGGDDCVAGQAADARGAARPIATLRSASPRTSDSLGS